MGKKAKIEDIRQAAKIVSEVLQELEAMTVPDVQLNMLNEVAHRRIIEMGGEPILKGYKPKWANDPFPASICASVDYEICHGIPNERVLKEGNIVTYDIGLRYKSACGDAAITVAVGEIDNAKQRLIRYAKRSLMAGISVVKAGQKVSAIGTAIQLSCLENGFQPIAEYGGHTIGAELHEKPEIPSVYYKQDDGIFLQEDQVICIEPMIVRQGYGKVAIAPDGWTAYEASGQPVAQFEHMILVTKNGYEILTSHIK